MAKCFTCCCSIESQLRNRWICRPCLNKEGRDRRAKNPAKFRKAEQESRDRNKGVKSTHRWFRVQLIKVAKSNPCTDCGGIYPPCVMHFDHVSGKKLNIVSRMKEHSIKAVEEEIAKCELVCANCHAIRTELRRLDKLSG